MLPTSRGSCWTTRTGKPVASTIICPFVGAGYLYDNEEEKGKNRVRFTPKLSLAGRYEVWQLCTTQEKRGTHVSVIIRAADAKKSVLLHQCRAPEDGRARFLGILDLTSDTVRV